MVVVFAKQGRSEPDLDLWGGWVDWAFKGQQSLWRLWRQTPINVQDSVPD